MSDDPALERIEQALVHLGANHVPPPGWESRVLAAVAAAPAKRHWILGWLDRPRWVAAAGLAAAAAVVLLYLFPPGPEAVRALALATTVERGGETVRGLSAHPGDTVHVIVRGGRYRHLWVYRDENELVARCPGESACRASGDELAIDVVLERVGNYSIVALSADGPLPDPRGRLDEDVAGAEEAGAKREMDDVVVR